MAFHNGHRTTYNMLCSFANTSYSPTENMTKENTFWNIITSRHFLSHRILHFAYLTKKPASNTFIPFDFSTGSTDVRISKFY